MRVLVYKTGFILYLKNEYWINIGWNWRLVKNSGLGLIFFTRQKPFKDSICHGHFFGINLSISYVNHSCDLPIATSVSEVKKQ